MIFDKGEAGQDAPAVVEEKDDVETKIDPKVNKPVDEQGGDGDADGGTEAGEVGEDGVETPAEDGTGESDAGGEPDPAQVINDLTARITELEGHITSLKAPPPAQMPPKQPEISEEDWANAETSWGIPRTGIQNIARAQAQLEFNIKNFVRAELSEFRMDRSIAQLAKDPEYADALKHDADIREYLKKVDPQYHTNQDVLKDAVIWSRGKNYKGAVQKVRDEREVNKRIAGSARPAAPTGGQKPSATKLTPLEKRAASSVGWTESEYAKQKSKGRLIAA